MATEAVISAPHAHVLVRVIQTDEERTIAEAVCQVLRLSRAREGGS